ncbi:hypothetical protein DL98DRAFT_101594 [Cadophora sp. DSE1049]|nr:hypothetical protein DL98DRAFT_101594 [Cadophora sp. DSE1049]
MENSSTIDLRVLHTSKATTSIRNSVGERPGSPQSVRSLGPNPEQAEDDSISRPSVRISNAENENQNAQSAEDDASSLEEYLQNRAYSNDEARRLLYNYKAFKRQPGIALFYDSIGVLYPETFAAAMADQGFQLESGVEEWLEGLRIAVRAPPSGGLRICVMMDRLPGDNFEFNLRYPFYSKLYTSNRQQKKTGVRRYLLFCIRSTASGISDLVGLRTGMLGVS